MKLAAKLQSYADSLENEAVVWGKSDCCLFVARWVEIANGKKLALPAFDSEGMAKRLIAKAGGLEALWAEIAGKAGMYETRFPEIGDVGLIALSTGPVGAIWCQAGYALIRADIGLTYVNPRSFIKAWSL